LQRIVKIVPFAPTAEIDLQLSHRKNRRIRPYDFCWDCYQCLLWELLGFPWSDRNLRTLTVVPERQFVREKPRFSAS